MAASNQWTEEKVALSRELYDAGMSAGACANALSDKFGATITRNAVIGIWFRKRIGGRRKPKPTTTVKRRNAVDRPTRLVRIIRPTAYGHLDLVKSIETDLPELRVAETSPLHLDLLDLEHHHCRYPLGESPYRFCAQPVDGKSSWCKACAAIVFQPAKERRRA